MSEIFDLDAIKPRDRKEPFRFKFGGEEFETNDPHDFDVRDLADADDPSVALALLLGEDGWHRLNDLDAVFSLDHFQALTEKWFEYHGLDLGKPSGSRKPSRATRTR